MTSEVVTFNCKKCYVDRGWYCPESFYYPSLLDHKVGSAIVVPPVRFCAFSMLLLRNAGNKKKCGIMVACCDLLHSKFGEDLSMHS
jgi:hypothetical protein